MACLNPLWILEPRSRRRSGSAGRSAADPGPGTCAYERSCYFGFVTRGAQTRTAVLEAATEQARVVGLRGLTIGVLAERTELSKSGLFAHFKSKESLQLAVLEHAGAQFIDQVLRPSLQAPRGEPRLRDVFARWLAWADVPGGCPFVTAAVEFDDDRGPVHRQLVQYQRDWLDSIAQIVRGAISDGQFSPGVDPDQFAFELHGVMLSYHHLSRLVGDAHARDRATRAFESLLSRARSDTA
jgi:AcrR family transcriptional regulator